MPGPDTLLVFAALSLGLALTPGPNMLYLVSRALAQGTRAGMVSLIGCQAGSLAIMPGAVQIAVCTGFDAALVKGASGSARFLAARPMWLAAQRWILGGALALLAVKLAFSGRQA